MKLQSSWRIYQCLNSASQVGANLEDAEHGWNYRSWRNDPINVQCPCLLDWCIMRYHWGAHEDPAVSPVLPQGRRGSTILPMSGVCVTTYLSHVNMSKYQPHCNRLEVMDNCGYSTSSEYLTLSTENLSVHLFLRVFTTFHPTIMEQQLAELLSQAPSSWCLIDQSSDVGQEIIHWCFPSLFLHDLQKIPIPSTAFLEYWRPSNPHHNYSTHQMPRSSIAAWWANLTSFPH